MRLNNVPRNVGSAKQRTLQIQLLAALNHEKNEGSIEAHVQLCRACLKGDLGLEEDQHQALLIIQDLIDILPEMTTLDYTDIDMLLECIDDLLLYCDYETAHDPVVEIINFLQMHDVDTVDAEQALSDAYD